MGANRQGRRGLPDRSALMMNTNLVDASELQAQGIINMSQQNYQQETH